MEEKRIEFWNIFEIIELNKKIFPVLGWKGNNNLQFCYNNILANDLIWFIDIRHEFSKTKIRELIKKSNVLNDFEWNILNNEDKDNSCKFILSITLSKGR